MAVFEFLNRVELKGIVAQVKTTPVGDNINIRLAVVTQCAARDNKGNWTVENTWFNVTAFTKNVSVETDKLQKGTKVHITGRLRAKKYVDSTGQEKFMYEIVASAPDSIEIIDDESGSVPKTNK